MTRTVTKLIRKLDGHEFRQLWGLNLGPDGYMQPELTHDRIYAFSNTKAVMLKDENDKILAWAMVRPNTDYHSVYFYTRKSERRKGHGRKLYKLCTKRYGRLRVWPHDKLSVAFLKNWRDEVNVTDYTKRVLLDEG